LNSVYIEKLKLTTFRNHGAMSVDLGSSHVVLTGDNGAGKTNILEAVSFLSPGRGLRRTSYDKVGKAGGSGAWTVFAQMQGAQGDVKIGTGLQETAFGVETSRKVHINGVQAKTSDELLEHSRILWLTPSMDGLFTGATSDRRRFLDRLVLAVDPRHGRRVADFEKSMRARNKLLSEDYPDQTWLDATETQLADVSISGSLENEISEISATDLEVEYLDRLRNNRRIDARAGRTLEGPHRSDLIVQHRPKSMPASQCSTGEQKALLIGLLLAHARLVGEMHDATPILLLDEVAAHLDEGRRAALYDMIDALGCQAWMTGTDRDLFKALDNRAIFLTVDDGIVSSEKSAHKFA